MMMNCRIFCGLHKDFIIFFLKPVTFTMGIPWCIFNYTIKIRNFSSGYQNVSPRVDEEEEDARYQEEDAHLGEEQSSEE